MAIAMCCSLTVHAQNTCDTAVEVTAGLHTVDAVDGTEIPLPVCSTNGEGATAGEWYAYTPTNDHYVTVTTDLEQNAGGDTRIQVYEGDCGDLVCKSGDDDSGIIEGGGGNSYLSITSFSALAGETYYIAFDNRWNSSGFDFMIIEDNAYGEFVLEGEKIPSIKSLDKKGQVIYLHSFSKMTLCRKAKLPPL